MFLSYLSFNVRGLPKGGDTYEQHMSLHVQYIYFSNAWICSPKNWNTVILIL